MILDKNISVIIPVYNAAALVEKAVESALMQRETKEVILVEDGSADGSLKVCDQLAGKYKLVKLFIHPGNSNKGAGASRNLGIANASGDFIAFLDADDYYLSNRFRAERKIFVENPETDGVYGALGFHYYSQEGRKKYEQQGHKELTTLSGKVSPRELFLSLLWLHEKVNGHFHLNSLTVKKKVFLDKTDLFNDLKLHEDTVFIIQLALNCQLEAGVIDEPVGMRGVHDNNRIVTTMQQHDSLVLMWKALYHWAKKSPKGNSLVPLFRRSLMKEKVLSENRYKALWLWSYFSLTNKYFLNERMFFNPCCFHVFGRYGNHVINLKERMLKGTQGTFFTPSEKLMQFYSLR